MLSVLDIEFSGRHVNVKRVAQKNEMKNSSIVRVCMQKMNGHFVTKCRKLSNRKKWLSYTLHANSWGFHRDSQASHRLRIAIPRSCSTPMSSLPRASLSLQWLHDRPRCLWWKRPWIRHKSSVPCFHLSQTPRLRNAHHRLPLQQIESTAGMRKLLLCLGRRWWWCNSNTKDRLVRLDVHALWNVKLSHPVQCHIRNGNGRTLVCKKPSGHTQMWSIMLKVKNVYS